MESKFAKKEAEILKFWQDKKIFEKSLKKDSPKGDYVFYDGPPFATGTPHYGHIVASLMKDVVPRFWTMRGYHVERKWGWDTHGLPIENIVEKELGFKTKKEIIKYGIDKFNETCRSKVLEYAGEWEKFIPRLGRWADMDNAYKTMDLDYMESVWWVFKELWTQDLIYKDYKSMHVCPRCETTLSQMEVSEGYKNVIDPSVTAKFELTDESGTYLLAWTTTPWTLTGNSALYLNKDFKYVKVKLKGSDGQYIIAKDLVANIFEKDFEIIEEYKAKDLVGKKYKPLYDYNAGVDDKYYHIDLADFVTLEQGTGVVHSAIMYGEEDFERAREQGLKPNHVLNMDGRFKDTATLVKGLFYKDADSVIMADLKKRGLVFNSFDYEHSYPHCWRCETPLLNFATSSWFVNVTKIKDKAIKLAEEISWSPVHLKVGRFGKWLEGARDWSISRQRFWASVMPIWVCGKCDEKKVYGSVKDLAKDSGKKITDLHKHIIDKVVVPCKCGGEMKRVPDVLDTWFDSGSMPYAQMHYPFENKKKFEENFPAKFIAEGVDQTRAWFYYLHIISTAIKKKPAFKNVVANGIVLAKDGKKMAKKLQNYPDPNDVVDKYGADALRYYLLTSPVMAAETVNFSEAGVKEALQKNIMLIGNVLSFYLMYQQNKAFTNHPPANILDRWIWAKLNLLKQEVTEQMEDYNLVKATRPFSEFINQLSTWYLRRSRDRFKQGDQDGINTLGYVLLEFSKIAAPFIPFTAEDIYRQICCGEKESVHLADWPKVDKKAIDKKLLEQMDLVRQIVEKGLAARSEAGLKVRQPLASYTTSLTNKLDDELVDLIKDELNINELKFGKADKLDTKLTDELKLAGQSREIVRQINQIRKEAKLTINDKVVLYQEGLDKVFDKFGDEIKKATVADGVESGSVKEMKEVEGGKVGIKKD